MRIPVLRAWLISAVAVQSVGCSSSSDFFKGMIRGYGLEHGERHDLQQSAQFDTYVDRWEAHEAVQSAERAE